MGNAHRHGGPVGAAAPPSRRRPLRAAAPLDGRAQAQLPQGRSPSRRRLGADGGLLKGKRAKGKGERAKGKGTREKGQGKRDKGQGTRDKGQRPRPEPGDGVVVIARRRRTSAE